jgi:hypothetical protein
VLYLLLPRYEALRRIVYEDQKIEAIDARAIHLARQEAAMRDFARQYQAGVKLVALI